MNLNYRNVDIRVDDRLNVDERLLNLVRDYIDERFLRPVMVWHKRFSGPFMRFAIPEELGLPIPGAKTLSIRLDDCVGQIIQLDGWKRRPLTDDEIRDVLLHFWYEPVYVELGRDGAPWIDD